MLVWMLLVCGVLLSVEKAVYYLVWRYPGRYMALCAAPGISMLGEPVDVLHKLFYLFKALQIGVFFYWCVVFGETVFPSPTAGPPTFVVGVALISAGLMLNLGVFRVLGKNGVFYGNKLGHHIPWKETFPFSICAHPQYVGAVMSIWGFFLVMRFPNSDWWFLPLLETGIYILGARLER